MATRRKIPRWLFVLLVIGANLVATELVCYSVFKFAKDRFTFRETFDFDPKLIPKYVKGFDPELGWRRYHNTPYGERPRTNPTNRTLISTFGESYVAGADILHEDTWQNALASRLGMDVLNFGVGGYGPDQALLYYRKIAPRLNTPIVMFGFVPDSIGRIVHVYRNMLAEKDPIPLTKPRFEMKDGKLTLFPNFLKTSAEAALLRDPELLLRELGPHDAWLTATEKTLRRLPSFSFPFTKLAFSPAIWRQLLTSHPTDPDYPHARSVFWNDPKNTELFFAILDAFVAEVRATGSYPLLVLMPQRTALQTALENDTMIGEKKFDEYCATRHAPCFNSVRPFVQWLQTSRKTGKLSEYFTRTHLSAVGAELLADMLDDHLRGPEWSDVLLKHARPRHLSRH